jgi:hypothetical protein
MEKRPIGGMGNSATDETRIDHGYEDAISKTDLGSQLNDLSFLSRKLASKPTLTPEALRS